MLFCPEKRSCTPYQPSLVPTTCSAQELLPPQLANPLSQLLPPDWGLEQLQGVCSTGVQNCKAEAELPLGLDGYIFLKSAWYGKSPKLLTHSHVDLLRQLYKSP